jgi:large subunit ribosomal protein L4
MINIPVYDIQGKEVDQMQVDEAVLGGKVNPILLKQAIVMYHANKRQGTASNKSRGMVSGSTKKLYRQKGTGNARMGSRRSPVRVGGGVAFAKINRDFRQDMPKKQRRLARDFAVLSKLQSEDVVVVNQLAFEAPKTKDFAKILGNLKIDRSCLVAIEEYDMNLYKSVRNIPRVESMPVIQLNAGDICSRRKLLFTKAALEKFLNRSAVEDAGKQAEN